MHTLKQLLCQFHDQMEHEPYTENIRVYLHLLQSYSPANNFFHAKEILNRLLFANIQRVLFQLIV